MYLEAKKTKHHRLHHYQLHRLARPLARARGRLGVGSCHKVIREKKKRTGWWWFGGQSATPATPLATGGRRSWLCPPDRRRDCWPLPPPPVQTTLGLAVSFVASSCYTRRCRAPPVSRARARATRGTIFVPPYLFVSLLACIYLRADELRGVATLFF